MRQLVYLAHADPSVRGKYQAAFTRMADAPEVDLVFVNNFIPGKTSSAYDELAAQLKSGGRYLPELRKRFPAPRPVEQYGTTTAASFSAGYKLWQNVLSSAEDAAEVDGIVGIDSWHTGLDADGTAADVQLGGLVAVALRAKEGRGLVWLGHSDVPTPQKDYRDAMGKLIHAFASTTQVANEVRRLAGGEGGGFRIKPWNVRADNTLEHAAALNEWGPDWLAGAVHQLSRSVLADARLDDETPVTQATEPLGRRALLCGISEREIGVREVPGSGSNSRIQAYLAGCERGGVKLWNDSRAIADEIAWCAAFASWCLFQALRPGDFVPHKYRAAVREIWLDAMASGMARPAEVVRSGLYVPVPGDLWLGTRGGPAKLTDPDPFAATDGKGHAARFQTSGEAFTTLDGNHDNMIANVSRSVADPEFVGVVSHLSAPTVPGELELEIASRLWKLHDDIASGRDGLEVLDT